jgi:hypothetical protein
MMKKFNLAALSVAILGSFSATAQADLYSVQRIETPQEFVNLLPRDINDQGMLALLSWIPLDTEFDLTKLTPTLQAAIGIPTDADLSTYTLSDEQYINLMGILQDNISSSLLNVRTGTNAATRYDGQHYEFISPLDGSADLARVASTTIDTQFHALNQHNMLVGITSSAYTELPHTYTPAASADGDPQPVSLTYYQRDFTSRAMWVNGSNFHLYAPPETSYLGGESVMYDINENNVAVGAVSVGLSPAAVDAIEICEGLDPLTSVSPAYVCIWNLWHFRQGARANNLPISFLQSLSVSTNQSIYDMNAARWQLDANGHVIDVKLWGTLLERTGEEDLEDFSSYAYAINNNDIAVGQSWTYYDTGNDDWLGKPNTRIKMPAIFTGDEVKAVSQSRDYYWGSARDINDENIAIGFMLKSIQGYLRYVGFKYDVDTETFTELGAFFIGSSTIPNAINNSGLVVGSAEIDSSLETARRRVGFVYDINNASAGLINLNDAIACNSELFIVSADAINSQGQILATALEQVEQTGDNGQTTQKTLTRTVKLNPIAGGQIGNCNAEDVVIERQGAATGLLGMLSMLLIGGLITIRRRWSI